MCLALSHEIVASLGKFRREALKWRFPAVVDFLDQLNIAAIGPIWVEIGFSGILFSAVAIEHGIGQRTQHRLGVLPADGLERAKAVGEVNLLMADLAEIAHAVAAENFEDLVSGRGAGQADNRHVGGRLVPVVHGFDEGLAGGVAGGNGRFIDGSHRPVAFAHVGGLGILECIDGPENREPAVLIRRGQRREMR